MNEKIAELYKLSHVKKESESSNSEKNIFDPELFAQLIIKECIESLYEHKDVESFGIYPIRVLLVTKSCEDNIKKTFGMEWKLKIIFY